MEDRDRPEGPGRSFYPLSSILYSQLSAGKGSGFDVGADLLTAGAALEQALQRGTQGRRVATAEAEAVALDRGDIGVEGPELFRGHGARLAQVRPDAVDLLLVPTFQHHREALMAVRRHIGRPR